MHQLSYESLISFMLHREPFGQFEKTYMLCYCSMQDNTHCLFHTEIQKHAKHQG